VNGGSGGKRASRKEAIQAANEAVRREMAKDANEPDPNRKLTSDPKDDRYRKIWNETYGNLRAGEPPGPQKTPQQAAAGCPKAESLVNMVKNCPAANEIYKSAVLANGGKPPEIKLGESGKPSKTDFIEAPNPSTADPYATKKTTCITIDKTRNKCEAVQELIFELSNVSQRAEFHKVNVEAESGHLDRETYVKKVHRIEYEHAQQNVYKVFDACKGKWGCAKAKALNDEARNMGFEEYYRNVPSEHKDPVRERWKEYEQKRRLYLRSRRREETAENVYGKEE
jgi:hypothetical protein